MSCNAWSDEEDKEEEADVMEEQWMEEPWEEQWMEEPWIDEKEDMEEKSEMEEMEEIASCDEEDGGGDQGTTLDVHETWVSAHYALDCVSALQTEQARRADGLHRTLEALGVASDGPAAWGPPAASPSSPARTWAVSATGAWW